MLPQRSSLGSSGNRQFNCELTPYMRGKTMGLSLKSAKSTKIQKLLDVTCGAVQSTLSLNHLYNEGNSQK